MYGMIHKAARAYAIDQMGEGFWGAFAERNGLSDVAFVLGECYPDELTFSLIGALTEAMETPPADFLRAFGRYWIDFAGKGAYAHLMAIGGQDLPSFLANLNRMHDGLAVAMPGSKMPQFHLLEVTAEGLRVNYLSERQGLQPFVVGLLEGLCAMFGVAADVWPAADDEAVFHVRYRLGRAA
jgi:hypothetical protein